MEKPMEIWLVSWLGSASATWWLAVLAAGLGAWWGSSSVACWLAAELKA